MFDFVTIKHKNKKDVCEVYPVFKICKSKDLILKGGDFYAAWLDDIGLWSTNEQDVVDRVDKMIFEDVQKNGGIPQYMWDGSSGSIDMWHKYVQKQARGCQGELDMNLTFADDPPDRNQFASKRLPYALADGPCPCWDQIISTLYSPEERHKIEWAIGAIVTGESKNLQKFLVFYGDSGTGKSTILNIIQQLFDGYWCSFEAKALGAANASFALEPFKNNPLVAIQHDGDLSKIEDNTRLNSLISHETMRMNEKYKSSYDMKFNAFCLMGTNKPVKITDAKSGIIRRLIDVSPTGKLIPNRKYKDLMNGVKFELGEIANHCKNVYLDDPRYYNDYIPQSMLLSSNDFFNFIVDNYIQLKQDDGISENAAWNKYLKYCDDSLITYPLVRRTFRAELSNYFNTFIATYKLPDGTVVSNYYKGFKSEKVDGLAFLKTEDDDEPDTKLIDFRKTESPFDRLAKDFPAQYANEEGSPCRKWDDVTTTLSDIDTSKLHFVRFPEDHKNHIVIDFDIPDESGNKSLERNLEAASKWPPTYAELSKSGCGIHLHYIYAGDVDKLSRIYDNHIEVKVFTGKSSLRRKLTFNNGRDISVLSSGLPEKEVKQTIDPDIILNEKGIRTTIKKCLNKEIHPATKPSIDFIYKILEDANSAGIKYDVTDLRPAVISFANSSTNQAPYCLALTTKMKFSSEESSDDIPFTDEKPIVFFDVEVLPNLFVICWKFQGKEHSVNKMINPSVDAVINLTKYRLIGFNNKGYDNHILYARMLGEPIERLFEISRDLISNDNPFKGYSESKNLSYTDIYDFASAPNKQSLKKWEIALGIHHQELGLPWDQPVPEDMFETVADYCCNDVLATEALFDHLKEDWSARLILADIADMTPNASTNSLTTRIVFGKDRAPQSQFNYRFMGDVSQIDDNYIPETMVKYGCNPEYTKFNSKGQPVFPGYTFDRGKSLYRGIEAGEGGFVWALPGMYGNVALLDIASMHPTSTEKEELFGPEYTKRFSELKKARVLIKHHDYEGAKKLMGGKLEKYLKDDSMADALATALKTPINSMYGLTAAHFDNAARDPRNKDNIVAKRGALFMINLKYELEARGYKCVHFKTDSVKIADATPEAIQFVIDYGRMYGYDFEHEATYDRMCLVNNAVYIALYASLEKCYSLYGEEYVNAAKDVCKGNKKHPREWTATGAQFAVPYVFKTLFSKEPIIFSDMCETKAVKTNIYLDFNEDLSEFEHDRKFVGKVGLFCPIKHGCGGAEMVRETEDKKTGGVKYDAVTGTKGYRWLEAEMVKNTDKEADIDISYYRKLVDDAINGSGTEKNRKPGLMDYGDPEWFCSDATYIPSDPHIYPF